MKTKTRRKSHGEVPETLVIAGKTIRASNKIPHQQILEAAQNCNNLVEVYHREVLPHPTRTIRLLGRKSSAKILHTLLGYEVQASYKRIQCPDLVTAQYLRVFSELGCHSIKLPYDPTLTARLIPDLESALDSITLTVGQLFPGNTRLQQYVTQRIYGIVRRKLENRKSSQSREL